MSVGVATDANSKFLSSTVIVVDSIVVVSPNTVKLPVISMFWPTYNESWKLVGPVT